MRRSRHHVVMRFALLLSLVVATACTQPGPPTRDPDISGLVTQVSQSGDTLLVEERPQDVSGSAKASVRVTSATRVWRMDGAPARIDAAQLGFGTSVRVWFTGPVATSYPVQATASDIAIDPHPIGAGLYVISKGASEVSVRVNAFEAARVACNAGAAIRPGADRTPDLPWEVIVTRLSDGRVLLDDHVTVLPRWLLVQRDSAGISNAPIAGPFVPCP